LTSKTSEVGEDKIMFEKYLEQVENILMQYKEGAVFAEEAFNAIVARAIDVTNTDEYLEHLKVSGNPIIQSDEEKE
jgi:hypothetical protein